MEDIITDNYLCGRFESCRRCGSKFEKGDIDKRYAVRRRKRSLLKIILSASKWEYISHICNSCSDTLIKIEGWQFYMSGNYMGSRLSR